MSLYNFLDSKALPSVSTSAGALDDYEVDNLIHENPVIRSRGFIAYSSIKPPIDLTFEFICNVHIHYIKLKTRSGAHKTTGIEILAGSPLMPISYKVYEEDGLLLCDSKYYTKENLPPHTFHLVSYFNSYRYKSFTNTKTVCVRIVRTDSRSVPCLESIEVWGTVSKSCSASIKNKIFNLMSEKCIEANVLTKVHGNVILSKSFKIPDEFLDALTFHVMTLPMTLPSGNTIDKDTLEKCISNDILYGRKPSDPFTGLEFLLNRKPILNAALKTRLDTFLINYAHQPETSKVARTLGTGKSLEPIKNKKIKLDTSNEPKTGDNLDDAIAKVIGSNSFTCFTRLNTDTTTSSKFNICIRCSSVANLYQITLCQHFFCKLCLLSLKEICMKCNRKFKSSNVVKSNC